jgi:hypothetical protein
VTDDIKLDDKDDGGPDEPDIEAPDEQPRTDEVKE